MSDPVRPLPTWRWEVKQIPSWEAQLHPEYFEDGWEPFAVDEGGMWCRRRVTMEEPR